MLYYESSKTEPAEACLKLSRDFKPMPKLKSHRGAAKRFKKTGTGKIVRRHAFARHILTSKARSRKRRLTQGAVVDPANAPRIARMLTD